MVILKLHYRFINLYINPPSYPTSFFTTGRAVGIWVGMRTHMQAPRCLWKRRNLRTSADPNIVDYFSPPLAEKRSDIGSEWMAQLFLQALMLLGKGALFAKTRREERQTWSKCSLPKMERLKNPHCSNLLFLTSILKPESLHSKHDNVLQVFWHEHSQKHRWKHASFDSYFPVLP